MVSVKPDAQAGRLAGTVPQLSVVVPVHDEAENLPPLVDEIARALDGRLAYEIVCVDDASEDATPTRLAELARARPQVRFLRHRRRGGQSAAIADLPFGGVGNSGFGAYNGKHTFELFSHHKSVLHRKTWLDSDIRYPPFTDSKKSLTLRLLNFQLPSLPSLSTTAGLVVSSYLGYQLYLRRQNVLPAWQRLNSKL